MTFLSYFLQCFCCALATVFVSDGPLVSVWYPPCTCQHETKETLCRWWLRARGHTVCADWVGGTGERTPSNIDTTLLQYRLHTLHIKRNMKMASIRWADRHLMSKHYIAPHLINRNVYCKPTFNVDLSPQQSEPFWIYMWLNQQMYNFNLLYKLSYYIIVHIICILYIQLCNKIRSILYVQLCNKIIYIIN